MRGISPAFIIVIAVLMFAALLAFDSYEYDGQYRAAAWDGTRHQIDSWLGKDDH